MIEVCKASIYGIAAGSPPFKKCGNLFTLVLLFSFEGMGALAQLGTPATWEVSSRY